MFERDFPLRTSTGRTGAFSPTRIALRPIDGNAGQCADIEPGSAGRPFSFRVLIEGSNHCIPGEQDEPPIAGFLAARVVWATDMGNAEGKALGFVRGAWENGDYAKQPTSGQRKLAVTESGQSSFRQWLRGPNKGHTFVPAEQEGDAPSAVPAG